jgi:hypothetical protein
VANRCWRCLAVAACLLATSPGEDLYGGPGLRPDCSGDGYCGAGARVHFGGRTTSSKLLQGHSGHHVLQGP